MSKSRDIADSAATINFIDTVTSNVQTQLGTKAPLASPTFTGTVTADSLSLGDNDKATFGAGNDLEIYHDGANNYVDGVSGAVFVRGSRIDLRGANNELMLVGNQNGSIISYYDNAAKLATTSTGIDVTGTVAATAFTGDGSALTGIDSLPSQTGQTGLFLTTNGSAASWGAAGGGALELISTTTISGSPNTIDITSGFSSTYDNYIVIASGVRSSANNDNVYMQVYKNSTLVTSSYTYNTQAGSQLFNYSGFNNIAYVSGADSGWQVNITNANSGFFSMNSTGVYRGINVGYNTTGTGIVTGIRFLFQSGSTTFTQGQIRLYGFKKS